MKIDILASCVNENLAVNGECLTSTSIPCRWLFDGAVVGSVSGDIGDWVQYDFAQDVNMSVIRMFQYRVRQVEFMFSDDETQLVSLRVLKQYKSLKYSQNIY